MDLFTRDDERRLNNLTLLVYILQGISLFTGLPMVVAVIINYLKRDDCQGTLYESHFDWQISTFWFCLLGTIVGYALVWIFVGLAIWGLTWLWGLYRVLRGILALNDGKALPH
ncbi:hypothetical protein [Aquitalea sp. ASV11]|uniref:DUF4870 family protein n=1 Tax=Aquitalea sp. ASV11 TaxID=2795103 RepID=UPI0018EB7F89|nr:hypothetical protein [Aquitalea sp. ASV11]